MFTQSLKQQRLLILFLFTAGCTLSSCRGHQLGDTWIRPRDQMIMVFVPKGEFPMGSSKEMVFSGKEICKESIGQISAAICKYSTFMDEYPDHSVEMPDFWLDQTEVTNGQYKLCLEAGICDPPKEMGSFFREDYFNDPDFDDYPVVQVTWNMAADYCA